MRYNSDFIAGALTVLIGLVAFLAIIEFLTNVRRIRPILKWCDFWVGFYWDAGNRRLYIFPLPMVGLMVQFEPKI